MLAVTDKLVVSLPPCYQIGLSVSVYACHIFAHYLPCRAHGNIETSSDVIHLQRMTFVGGVLSGDTVYFYMREEVENIHRLYNFWYSTHR